MKERVITVVAHPDDEIIGVGGTLRKHVVSGDEVHVLILGDGKTSRGRRSASADKADRSLSVRESTKAASLLGIHSSTRLDLPDNRFDSILLLDIVKEVSRFVARIDPDVVFTHHYGDLNVDHRKTYEAVITACRPIENAVEKILLFETLSSTEMAGPTRDSVFLPNYYVDIHNELGDKLAAMSAYKSELREYPHPRSLETIRNNALVWGSKVNMPAAEAFSVFRFLRR